MKAKRKVLFTFLCSSILLVTSSCIIPDRLLPQVPNFLLPTRSSDSDSSSGGYDLEDLGSGDAVQNPSGPPGIEIKPTPLPPEPRLCVAFAEDIRWGYEDIKTSSGTGGATCSGKFSFQNMSAEPVVFMLYTLYNNGSMESSDWQGYSLEPEEKTSVQVSEVEYKDGTNTYNKVQFFIAVRDVPECWFFLTDEARDNTYKASYQLLATPIKELPCP